MDTASREILKQGVIKIDGETWKVLSIADASEKPKFLQSVENLYLKKD